MLIKRELNGIYQIEIYYISYVCSTFLTFVGSSMYPLNKTIKILANRSIHMNFILQQLVHKYEITIHELVQIR